jgi:hypothetical protein
MLILSPKHKRNVFVGVVIPALALAIQCGSGEPRTDADRLARGRELIERMSAKLASARFLSVSTSERSERIRPGGAVQPFALTRRTLIRRPDRLHFKASGDTDVEGWYDGIGLTVVMHKEKVFGQAKMPETLDKVLDTLHERYGIATPLADFLYTDPSKAFLADTTTGGWVGRETVDGQQTDHLAFKDTGVSWEIWLATADQLPRKGRADFSENKRLRKVEVSFTEWNLAPAVADDSFKPSVPPDFEGIALIQRARSLRHLPRPDAGRDQEIATWRIESCV